MVQRVGLGSVYKRWGRGPERDLETEVVMESVVKETVCWTPQVFLEDAQVWLNYRI